MLACSSFPSVRKYSRPAHAILHWDCGKQGVAGEEWKSKQAPRQALYQYAVRVGVSAHVHTTDDTRVCTDCPVLVTVVWRAVTSRVDYAV